jgi:predicted outer membrane protein
MRFVAASASVLSLAFLLPAPGALAADEKVVDAQALLALEARANQATPREQCFLYAEIVHDMTELAGRQLSAGDIEQASGTIKIVQEYAAKIHMDVSADSKRLKNAEILMRHTAFRLKDILAQASLDDRPTLDATLKQLDQVQAEMMLQVFRR